MEVTAFIQSHVMTVHMDGIGMSLSDQSSRDESGNQKPTSVWVLILYEVLNELAGREWQEVLVSRRG